MRRAAATTSPDHHGSCQAAQAGASSPDRQSSQPEPHDRVTSLDVAPYGEGHGSRGRKSPEETHCHQFSSMCNHSPGTKFELDRTAGPLTVSDLGSHGGSRGRNELLPGRLLVSPMRLNRIAIDQVAVLLVFPPTITEPFMRVPLSSQASNAGPQKDEVNMSDSLACEPSLTILSLTVLFTSSYSRCHTHTPLNPNFTLTTIRADSFDIFTKLNLSHS